MRKGHVSLVLIALLLILIINVVVVVIMILAVIVVSVQVLIQEGSMSFGGDMPGHVDDVKVAHTIRKGPPSN